MLHTLPQAPQLLGSVATAMQLSPQRSSPAPQPETQPVVGSQTGVMPEQTVAQSRQVEVDERLASQPSAAVTLQSAKPASHEAIAHVPVAQVSVARGSEHAMPQAPQLVTVRSEVSHPFVGSPSQSSQPASHAATAHVPVAQVAVAFGKEQATPQPPQCVVVVRGCSQPVASSPSQSP